MELNEFDSEKATHGERKQEWERGNHANQTAYKECSNQQRNQGSVIMTKVKSW